MSRIGVDETSFQKRHEYVMVLNDLDTGHVVSVADGRGQEVLESFCKGLRPEQRAAIQSVSMDMWRPCIQATQSCIPGWERKVCFARFHVAKHLGDALNEVRRMEHQFLLGQGDQRLKGTRYLWLMEAAKRSRLPALWRREFNTLKRSSLKVSQAWAICEMARGLWGYPSRGWTERGWQRWLSWALRSRLEPVRKAAKMIRRHLWGIINAVVHQVTNATSESLNAKIQWVKRSACGFRKRERFRTAILFHYGGLDLYPRAG